MAIDYASLQATAKTLLASFGTPRTIIMERDGPSSGTEFDPTPGVIIPEEVTGVVLPASKGTIEAFDNRLKDGTLIDEKLRFVILAALDMGFEPKGGDHLRFDDAKWLVLGATPVSPGGVPIIYKMGVKRIK